MTDREVRELLASVDEVVIVRGPSMRRMPSAEVDLDQLRRPSGEFRAPMIKRGKTLLVGFNGEALEELLTK